MNSDHTKNVIKYSPNLVCFRFKPTIELSIVINVSVQINGVYISYQLIGLFVIDHNSDGKYWINYWDDWLHGRLLYKVVSVINDIVT
jgi:hypothetical protein